MLHLVMNNFKRAQKDTSLLYKQLVEKQKEFIRKNTNQRDCAIKKKIVVSPAFLTFAKEYEKNSLELDERIAKYTSKECMDSPSRNVSSSLRENGSPIDCCDRFYMQSPRIKRVSKKETMLLALHDSETFISDSPSILQHIKHELSTDKLERIMKKSKKLVPILASPKRFKFIKSKFGKECDTSWMYKHRNLEDLLRNDCENRVKQVIDEALNEFEIDPARYI